jgi:beta-aspartyl-peptidase (threonine type)
VSADVVHPHVEPILLVHAGAGSRSAQLLGRADEYRNALQTTIQRARAVLDGGGDAVAAVEAAVMYMEDEVELFNAGRGSVLCSDGTVEMSAALMRGPDRAAGAVAGLRATRRPILAARAVLEGSPHVLLAGDAADAHAQRTGLEQRPPDYFITERQRRASADGATEFVGGTVGSVCRDRAGGLAAATSTGGRRGQWPGRVGDTPTIGAGTWADGAVAVSCTGDGEAFIRAGAARQISALVAGGMRLEDAAGIALADVAALDGEGGLIAVSTTGEAAWPFTSAAMPRALWRGGDSDAEIRISS